MIGLPFVLGAWRSTCELSSKSKVTANASQPAAGNFFPQDWPSVDEHNARGFKCASNECESGFSRDVLSAFDVCARAAFI
jgi:hypothetical protein